MVIAMGPWKEGAWPQKKDSCEDRDKSKQLHFRVDFTRPLKRASAYLVSTAWLRQFRVG